jgi:hypothetical protein
MKRMFTAVTSVLFLCSLVVNAVLIRSTINEKHQIEYAETKAMEHATAEINVASSSLQTNKKYAIAMLAEAGGTFIALQDIVSSLSKGDTASDLFNVGYYLHYQATATSLKGLSQFTQNADRLLQSHVSKGQYDVSHLSSDAAKLNEMLPSSFH